MRKILLPFIGLLALILTGCGSNNNDFVYTASPNAGGVSTLQINHQVLGRAIPAGTQLRVTVLDASTIAFGPETVPGSESVSININLQGDFTLRIEYLDANGVVFGLFVQDITLAFGQTTVIEDPAWVNIEDVVTNLTVAPSSISIAVGTSSQLTATATFGNGVVADVSDQVAWSSDNEEAATVNNTGLVSAAALGTATITAELGGRTATSSVTVVSVPPPPGDITSLTVDPATASITKIAPGNTTQLNALAGFDGGPTDQNVNDQVTWTVDPADAGVTVVNGLVTSNDAELGDYTVTATFPDSAFSESAVVTVVTAVTGFEVDPTEATIGDNAPGNTVQINALAGFDGGANDQNVNDQAEWTVTPEGQGVTVVDGLVTAEIAVPGEYTVTATFSELEASATVTVVGSFTLDQAGTFTLDTTDGTLTDPDMVDGDFPGWNEDTNEVELHNFTIAAGTTLRVIGPNPFVARLGGNATIEGTIDASGGNGTNGGNVNGAGVVSGGAGGSAGPGGGAGGAGGDNSALPANAVDLPTSSAAGEPGVAVGTNGGGGGGVITAASTAAGGGGGGHSAAGSNGSAQGAATVGVGGSAYPSIDEDTLIGGSGGGGGSHRYVGTLPNPGTSNRAGGGGGGGGGVVAIFANFAINLGGSIDASGGNGGVSSITGAIGETGGSGGGGAGGSVLLVADDTTGVDTNDIDVSGGDGPAAAVGAAAGGDGAAGRVIVSNP